MASNVLNSPLLIVWEITAAVVVLVLVIIAYFASGTTRWVFGVPATLGLVVLVYWHSRFKPSMTN
jgi:hypothetical protein